MMQRLYYPENKAKIEERFEQVKLNLWDLEKQVFPIIQDISENGDSAVLKYTEKFDGVNLSSMEVTQEEIDEGYNTTSEELKKALEEAAKNIYDFHLLQLKKQKEFAMVKQGEMVLSQRHIPMERAGLYVPGGRAPYPSTVLMTAIPAKVAGVSEIIMITPPGKDGKINPVILAAAKICNVDRLFKVGGVQGIAAMAYGTESIPKVDVIVGPGNMYVTAAKKMLYGVVDIDMVAGPSEIMIIADEKAKPSYIAADMMSQAEHDEVATSVLVVFDDDQADEVEAEIARQMQTLERKETIEKSLSKNGMIIIADNAKQAIHLANMKAPEHLEIMTENYQNYVKNIRNAGAVFLGYYTPEPVGDYYAGPNHTLPTSGTARYYSPLGTYTFMKRMNLLYYSAEKLKSCGKDIELLAQSEGFTAHKNSISIRMADL